MGHKRWIPPTGEREQELREQMVQYVEGYILACEDVLRDIGDIMLTSANANKPEVLNVVQRINVEVQDSLRQARQSLRLWKGTSTDEQKASDTTAN